MKYIAIDIETTGLLPAYDNQITCICARTEDGDVFSKVGKDEYSILSEFYQWLAYPTDHYFLLTKNGKGFDIPFLIIRAAQIFEAEDFMVFKDALLSYKHYDMQYATKKWIKMADMAYLLGVTDSLYKKENPIQLFQNNQLSDLLKLCGDDVRITIECYLKYIALYPDKKEVFV